jgi:CBS domain-containing protein
MGTSDVRPGTRPILENVTAIALLHHQTRQSIGPEFAVECRRFTAICFATEAAMSVGRFCVREVDTAQPDETVAVAAQRMHQRAVGTLVVVNKASQVSGIITDRDLVSRVIAKGLSPLETKIRDVMTITPQVVTEEAPIETALQIMRRGRFRRIPVVGRANKLLGLVTLDDVLMVLAEEFTQIGGLLKRETPQAVVEDHDLSGITRLQGESHFAVGD